jgi:hypothetical protein
LLDQGGGLVRSGGMILYQGDFLLFRPCTERAGRIVSVDRDYILDRGEPVDARVQIERLIRLSGVKYPVASAILHLVRKDLPIVDVNALAAFGLKRRANYNFQFWNAYCDAVRAIVKESRLSYRTVDRALWSYGKDHPVR